MSDFQPGNIIVGYRLVEFLGKGGFGEVWSALSPGDVPVAVKFINRKLNTHGDKERFALDHIKGLKSDHLVTIRAIHCLDEQNQIIDEGAIPQAQHDGSIVTYVVAMDLGDRSLRDRLLQLPQGLPLAETLEHLDSIARGIDFLNHPKNEDRLPIVHRDIKPENVLIFDGDGEFGKAKVCDYGIAYPLDPDSAQTQSISGDFRYMSPEQTRGRKDLKTDQYALALTYYELRFGNLPIADKTLTSGRHQELLPFNGEADLSRASGKELEVLKKATSINPANRFENCQEFTDAIREALTQEPPHSRFPTLMVASISILLFFLAVTGIAVSSGFRPWQDSPEDRGPDVPQEPPVVKSEPVQFIVSPVDAVVLEFQVDGEAISGTDSGWVVQINNDSEKTNQPQTNIVVKTDGFEDYSATYNNQTLLEQKIFRFNSRARSTSKMCHSTHHRPRSLSQSLRRTESLLKKRTMCGWFRSNIQ